ncbi:uveal autoantigen with coiled-coil domains and ankyrin repeats [Cyclospora cayetanensis]|uniref:Uveal autoantigen with coiled-coil domains and ankyrin repeats n=2 Tax=Cyclospora cayetanensis TaxID=88456 RepID=A0A6P5WDI7_9EIME|nr:uveal autoantigen with coiled-coil domains and ankyrin repeats [Cyclospora cayetanensis]OEH75823.1 hypothetical protein cyc_04027 [Cyclospora cayetanensis]
MGQGLTTQEKHNIKREIYTLYPGLEQQLEMAFSCHDIEGALALPYATLEPVIRHLLMQYGLIEYVTRFSKESGALDPSHIRHELAEFGVATTRLFGDAALSVDDFKSLAVVWLKKILDTHADDQAEWMEKLRADQEEQSANYARAMKEFQEQYVKQQAIYQQGLEEQQRQIQDWNRLLEDAQKTQQQIYDEEVRRMKEIQDREARASEIAQQEELELIRKYQHKLEEIAKSEGGKCFVYPASKTPYGACASAGAQEPCRRKRNHARKENRLAKGCC